MNAALQSSRVSALPLSAAEGRAIIRRHSKSFSLASLLLAPAVRDAAVGLYAYCRRADDAIDLAPEREVPARLAQLQSELDDVYAGRALSQPVLSEFQRLVVERNIPREYPAALLEGFAADADGKSYVTVSDLYRYCWCVAGSVGAMMCHVLGVRHERAVVHGVHLGMAMQLTNICRDVAEDWQRGRLYLPYELVPALEYVRAAGAIPHASLPLVARAVRSLLAEARVLYGSGDLGLPDLEPRSRVAVASASRIYAAIGERILAADADVLAGRASVSTSGKLWCVARASFASLAVSLRTPRPSGSSARVPNVVLRFPEDVLPF